MLDRENLVALMRQVANAEPSAPVAYSFGGETLSYEALQEALRNEINELAGSWDSYRKNKEQLFSIMEEVIEDILPTKVKEAYERFAEVKTFPQGTKPLFRRRISARNRAKQFVTRVGLAGVYEVFKLGGSESFEVPTSAIGGAVQVSIEEFLDGRADFAEVLAILMEGMDDLIYEEIGKCLIGAINQLPAANVVTSAGFDENEMKRLVTIAGAYGTPVIYCTHEFAVRMVPQEGWRYTDAMKDQLYRTGRLADFHGTQVVILPQGFRDETNAEKVVNPGYCWIIPTGGNDKPIKVAFEGGTQIDERRNDDWSREVQVYKKVGVTAMMTNNICVFIDTELLGEYEDWYLTDTAAL